jgi:hypothetical protein
VVLCEAPTTAAIKTSLSIKTSLPTAGGGGPTAPEPLDD